VVCNKTFYSPAEFIRHVWQMHEKEVEHHRVVFQNKKELRERDGFDKGLRLNEMKLGEVKKGPKKRKTGKKSQAEKETIKCQKLSETDQSLLELSVNILPKLHDCNHCDKSFEKLSSLKLHKRNMHTYRCYNCKAVFPLKIELLNHDVLCSGSANKERDYDDTVNIQSLDAIFKCKQCGQQVMSKGALMQHFMKCRQVKA